MANQETQPTQLPGIQELEVEPIAFMDPSKKLLLANILTLRCLNLKYTYHSTSSRCGIVVTLAFSKPSEEK
jgi:hypothetical protein